MVPKLSSLQQKAVWEGWLSGEIRACYFGDLCDRYQRKQQVLTLLILIASSGAFLTLIGEWMPAGQSWVRPLLAAAASALSLWLLLAQNQKRSTDCSDLHARWQSLANDFQSLWDNMYAAEAIGRLEDLKKREVELGKSSLGFPNRPKLMMLWQNHVQRHHMTA